MSQKDISSLADFLFTRYYKKHTGKVPTLNEIERAVFNHGDKMLIVKDDNIKGVALFLRLTDKTYENLKELDLTKEAILFNLLMEYGDNLHFCLLVADGYKTIMTGMRKVVSKYKPKTVSWWNPDMTMLHSYSTEDLRWQQQSRG